MKRVLLVMLSFLVLLTGCGKRENELVMVTEAGFAPYEYYQNGEIVGVDIDIANEIAEYMGKKLVIAGGDSHSTSYYQSICEKAKEEEDIILTGFVQGIELAELFSNSYLYVLPSDIEGMPISLLEAMSYGNTCLVSDIDENTSIINQNSNIKKLEV